MKTAVQITMYLNESDKWDKILQLLRNEGVAGASALLADPAAPTSRSARLLPGHRPGRETLGVGCQPAAEGDVTARPDLGHQRLHADADSSSAQLRAATAASGSSTVTTSRS